MMKKISRMLLGMCLVLLAGTAFAQQSSINRYTTTTFTGTFTSINGNGGTKIGQGDDGLYSTTLPFSFNYDSIVRSAGSTFYASDNHNAGFTSPYPYDYSDYLGSSNGYMVNNMCIFQVDMISSASTGGIYVATQGSAPNRVFVIEWSQYSTYSWKATNYNSCQMKLYEATGVIEFLYLGHGQAMAGSSAGIGIEGSPYSNYIKYASSTSTPSTDLRFTPAQNVPPAQLSLRPKTLDYSGVSAGSTLTLYDTAYNLGPGSLKFNAFAVGGSSAFTLVSAKTNSGNTLNVGDTVGPTGYAVFGIQFAPSSSGGLGGSFVVVTSGKDSGTQTATLTGIGLAANVQYTFLPYNGTKYPDGSLFHHVSARFGDTATQSFYVTSNGTGPLSFTSISLSGLQSNMYRVSHVPPNPLPVGTTDSITVKFVPFYEGRPDATLTINTNAINMPTEVVTMWGVGMLPHLVITPQNGTIGTGTINGSLVFDSVAIGDSVVKTLALHNTGTDTLVLQKQIVTYGDYDFTYYPLTGGDLRLAPDATKLVNVSFVPLQAGLRMAQIRFYTNIPKTYPDLRDTSQVLMQISGVGVPYGKLAVTGSLIDTAIVGQSNCITETIKNTGSSDLTVNNVSLAGPDSARFAVSGFTTPFVLAAGATQTISLCYSPTVRGLSNALLNVTGTTSGRVLTQSLAITGVGQSVCANVSSNPLTFGSNVKYPQITLAHTMDTAHISVSNCGDVAMTFTADTGTGTSQKYTLLTKTTAVIPPQGNATIDVVYAPDTIGASAGSIIVTPNGPGLTATTIPLSGMGGGVYISPSGQASATAVGQSSTFDVTLMNGGNVAWNPGAPTVTGDYAVVGTVGSIPAGQSATLSIKFTPTAVGARTGQLTFPNADLTSFGTLLPYTLTANGIQGAGVAMHSAQDGFSIGASYPNPATNSAQVIVTMPREAKVTMALVRLDGSQIATVFDGPLAEGQHTMTLDVKSLPSGTYFYTLESGNVRLVREMIVTK